MLDFDISISKGLQVLLIAFVISAIFFGIYFGCPWVMKKWKEWRLSKSKTAVENKLNPAKLPGLTEGK